MSNNNRGSESRETTTVAPSTNTVGGIGQEVPNSRETEIDNKEEKRLTYTTKSIRLEL